MRLLASEQQHKSKTWDPAASLFPSENCNRNQKEPNRNNRRTWSCRTGRKQVTTHDPSTANLAASEFSRRIDLTFPPNYVTVSLSAIGVQAVAGTGVMSESRAMHELNKHKTHRSIPYVQVFLASADIA
jgi:hypothetical protein